jgi:hypothetical protein
MFLKEVWQSIANRYRLQIYESFLIEQWWDLDEMPEEMSEMLDKIITFPFVTRTSPILKAVLEHSILSSLQTSLIFESCTKEFIIENSLYVFDRIETSNIFKTVHNEITHASYVIQRHWKECISNPGYKVCIHRLLREFNELTGTQGSG